MEDRNPAVILYNEAARDLAEKRDEIHAARERGQPSPRPHWATSVPGGTSIDIPVSDLPSTRAMTTGQPVRDVLLDLHLNHGAQNETIVPLLTSATPVRGDDGQIDGALITICDLSQVKQMECERLTLIGQLTHQARGPVTTIRGRAQKLRRYIKPLLSASSSLAIDEAVEKIRYEIDSIVSESERMDKKIDLIDAVEKVTTIAGLQIENFVREAQSEPISLVAYVRETVNPLRELYGFKRFFLATSAADTELKGYWARGHLEIIIENLIFNALKYSPNDSSITFWLEPKVQDGLRLAHLLVQNEGFGIVPEDLDHIFEEDFRSIASMPNNREIKGSGRGLHMCRTLAREYDHGSVTVESVPGMGATFHLYLPLAPISEGRL